MTWVSFERAVKFFAGITWASWEMMIRQEPDLSRLVFIALVLGLSEFPRAIKLLRDDEQ
jgi:hypothetical protein